MHRLSIHLRVWSVTAILLVAVTIHAAYGKPNILIIVAGDLGYVELNCQGNPQIPTAAQKRPGIQNSSLAQ
jgi:hypothetical protein